MKPFPVEDDQAVADRYLVPYLLHRVASLFEQRWRTEQGGRATTIHRWQVLSLLSAVDGQRLGQIAELAGVSQPVMSRVVDQMQRDGLVERRPEPDDQRAVGVWTTDLGRATFQALMPSAEALVDTALDGLSDHEVAVLHGLLTRVVSNLDHRSSDPVTTTDAPVRATAAAVVAASPDAVFDVLADASSWQSWYPDLRAVVADRPLQEGDGFGFKTGPVTVEATVDSSRRGEELSFTGRSRGATAVYSFRFEPHDQGTRVHAEQTMSGAAARAMRPMMQKIAETSLPAWLEALRVRVEAGA